MHLAPGAASDVRLTLEATVRIVNESPIGPDDLRRVLTAFGFSRSAHASQASVERVARRMQALAPLLRSLPDLDADTARRRVNEQLTELSVHPSIVQHDGTEPHLHWTPATAAFDEQVATDVLMALALDLCDTRTPRIGRCAADGCDHLFYDATRNRSRRFCDDQRCASRTHTAHHRERHRGAP